MAVRPVGAVRTCAAPKRVDAHRDPNLSQLQPLVQSDHRLMVTIGLFRRFFPYVLANKRQAILNVGLVLIAPIVTAGLLWSFKRLIDRRRKRPH